MNFKGGTYEARRHHEGRYVNAAVSLRPIPRIGVQQLSLNVHWTSANVKYSVDEAAADSELHLVDSKDAKAIVLGDAKPVQLPGKSWKRTEYADHDWNQSRENTVTPFTHLFVETVVVPRPQLQPFDDDSRLIILPNQMPLYIKRAGKAVTILSLGYFEPNTAFRGLNDFLFLMCQPTPDKFFKNPSIGNLKDVLIFVVDNGPSVAPSNTLVQMFLVRLRQLLNIDKVVQKSFAEYNSKRNFVERVHAVENEALSKHG